MMNSLPHLSVQDLRPHSSIAPLVGTVDGALLLGERLGLGGEGSVYAVVNRPEIVAKIYHQPPSPEKSAKLRHMVAMAQINQTGAIDALVAWPRELLYHRDLVNLSRNQSDLPPIGFTMPRLNNALDIHSLYSPRSRKQNFPDADWRFLVRTAVNLARSFAAVHSAGIVVGDVNHSSITVSQQALVTLIDCDSFQLTDGESIFYCDVGTSLFTPPELQRVKLRETERTVNHDIFGMAVLIFQLLFMGRHPFAGRYLGASEAERAGVPDSGQDTRQDSGQANDSGIESAIRTGRFAYSLERETPQVVPPPHSLSLTQIPPILARLFEQSFARVDPATSRIPTRPRASQWVQILLELEQSLSPCRQVSTHHFYNHSLHPAARPGGFAANNSGGFAASRSGGFAASRGGTMASPYSEAEVPWTDSDAQSQSESTWESLPESPQVSPPVSSPGSLPESLDGNEPTGEPSSLSRAKPNPCPWCKIESDTGLLLFNMVLPTIEVESFSLDHLWQHIATIENPGPAPAPPEREKLGKLDSSPAAKSLKQQQSPQGPLGVIVVLLVFFFLLGLPKLWWLWLGVGVVALVLLYLLRRQTPGALRYVKRHKQAQRAYQILLKKWQREAGDSRYNEVLAELNRLSADYAKMPEERERLLAAAMERREPRQKQQYLERTLLHRATISMIGPERKAVLQSYSIECAADINRAALQAVPRVGQKLTQVLLDWRQSVEEQFRYNPSLAIDREQMAQVEHDYGKLCRPIEQNLIAQVTQLAQVRNQILHQRQALWSDLVKALRQMIQAELNVQETRG